MAVEESQDCLKEEMREEAQNDSGPCMIPA